MIKREITTDESGTIQLCRIYSDERYKLKQIDTGIVYGYECIDIIAGFDSYGIPYSAHQYEETNDFDMQEEEDIGKIFN